MPKRALVTPRDIRELWDYFADATDPVAGNIAAKVRVAAASTKDGVFLRHVLPGHNERQETDQLLEVGNFIAGTADRFRRMFGEDLKTLEFETDERNVLYIIPFRTASKDVRAIDTVLVLYGQDLAFMAFAFARLSEEGLDKVKETLS